MESRPVEFHQRVRQGFLTEAQRRPERIVVIDARPSVEEVQAVLRLEVSRLLNREG
jgi:dTMP kinase